MEKNKKRISPKRWYIYLTIIVEKYAEKEGTVQSN
jgi:hypothetical protein